jgi:hypothetical protein
VLAADHQPAGEFARSDRALKRMMAAMVGLFCDSFEGVPRRILLDIDDTEDRVHGGQQLALFNAHYDSRCFQPIHIYEATSGKPVAIILRPGKTLRIPMMSLGHSEMMSLAVPR